MGVECRAPAGRLGDRQSGCRRAVLCADPYLCRDAPDDLYQVSTTRRDAGFSSRFLASLLRCVLAAGSRGGPVFYEGACNQGRKAQRFRTGDERVIAKDIAFTLEDVGKRQRLAVEYLKTRALYYQGPPDFEVVLARIHQHIASM